MATTPNTQLTKLALGIASVAALAGITGRLSGGAVPQDPASKAVPVTVPQASSRTAAPAPAPQQEQQRTVSRERDHEHKHDDDDEEFEEEDEDDRPMLFFAPRSEGGGSATQPGQRQLQTRTRHS